MKGRIHGFAPTLLIVILCFGGCTLYTKPEVPSPQPPPKFKATINATNKNIPPNWWEQFHDPQLNQLVNLALKNNLNYQIALKNIQIAHTYVVQNASAYFPTIQAGYSFSRNQLSQNAALARGLNFIGTPQGFNVNEPFNYNQLYGTATYQVDLWNQIGNTVNQAQAEVKVAEAESDVFKLTLISDIVDTYFTIAALNANIKNQTAQLAAINQIVNLAGDQYQSGIINIDPLADLKNQAEIIKSNLSLTKKQQQIEYNTLAYLVGAYPEKFNYSIKPLKPATQLNKMIPANLPASVLAVRPDIQSAYYQVMSYGYLEKQNLANFLPNITLTGTYGFSSTQLSNLLTSPSIYWTFGGTALETVFDAANRISQYQRSEIQFQAAIMNYKDTVINAFKDVDNSLVSFQQDYVALAASKQEVANTWEKFSSANAQYQSGIYDYSTFLNYQLAYLNSEYNLTNQNLLVIQDIVQAYQALGLGLT